MNLKVYKQTEDGKVTGEELRTIPNLKTLTLEFDRGTFVAIYQPGTGPTVTEHGELSTLYKNGNVSSHLFEAASVKGATPVESAVGHLIDPTTTPTTPITSGTQKEITPPDATKDVQKTPTPDIKKK